VRIYRGPELHLPALFRIGYNDLYKAEGCNLFANAVAEAIRQALREKP
jgi:hypothetical protein